MSPVVLGLPCGNLVLQEKPEYQSSSVRVHIGPPQIVTCSREKQNVSVQFVTVIDGVSGDTKGVEEVVQSTVNKIPLSLGTRVVTGPRKGLDFGAIHDWYEDV